MWFHRVSEISIGFIKFHGAVSRESWGLHRVS